VPSPGSASPRHKRGAGQRIARRRSRTVGNEKQRHVTRPSQICHTEVSVFFLPGSCYSLPTCRPFGGCGGLCLGRHVTLGGELLPGPSAMPPSVLMPFFGVSWLTLYMGPCVESRYPSTTAWPASHLLRCPYDTCSYLHER